MMKPMFLILLTLALCPWAKAQDDYSGDTGAYGYTSVDYDASTNTITYYAESSIGSDGANYRGVYLGTGITDATTGQSLAYTATGATPAYPASCSGDLGRKKLQMISLVLSQQLRATPTRQRLHMA